MAEIETSEINVDATLDNQDINVSIEDVIVIKGPPGEPGKDGSDATATDVRIEGISITTDGVADIPFSNGTTAGVIITDNSSGGYDTGLIMSEGRLFLKNSGTVEITNRNHRIPILANNMDFAVKAAMCDGKGAAWTNTEKLAARERMNAADADKVYIMQKQIANLQGIAATEETDSTEAYTKTVPTGSQKWASLDSVGGKTVVWNQLINPSKFRISNSTVNGVTFLADSDGKITVSGTASAATTFLFYQPSATAGHKYLFGGLSGGSKGTFYLQADHFSYLYDTQFKITTIPSSGLFSLRLFVEEGITVNVSFHPKLFDLTQMFGAGNEPSTVEEFRAMFPADYYPEYNPGELMSAEVVEVESKGKNLAIVDTFPIPDKVRDLCPGYGWSAGTVCNEIDFGRKVYVQRVASVDLSTLEWSYYTSTTLMATNLTEAVRNENSSVHCICPIYRSVIGYGSDGINQLQDKTVSVGSAFVSVTQNLVVCDKAYTDAESFKAAMSGVLLYYELAKPVEVDLSNVLPDDHFIEVEAGGTVTFKQAYTQLSVPSSVTYQVSTKEAIANA